MFHASFWVALQKKKELSIPLPFGLAIGATYLLVPGRVMREGGKEEEREKGREGGGRGERERERENTKDLEVVWGLCEV